MSEESNPIANRRKQTNQPNNSNAFLFQHHFGISLFLQRRHLRFCSFALSAVTLSSRLSVVPRYRKHTCFNASSDIFKCIYLFSFDMRFSNEKYQFRRQTYRFRVQKQNSSIFHMFLSYIHFFAYTPSNCFIFRYFHKQNIRIHKFISRELFWRAWKWTCYWISTRILECVNCELIARLNDEVKIETHWKNGRRHKEEHSTNACNACCSAMRILLEIVEQRIRGIVKACKTNKQFYSTNSDGIMSVILYSNLLRRRCIKCRTTRFLWHESIEQLTTIAKHQQHDRMCIVKNEFTHIFLSLCLFCFRVCFSPRSK